WGTEDTRTSLLRTALDGPQPAGGRQRVAHGGSALYLPCPPTYARQRAASPSRGWVAMSEDAIAVERRQIEQQIRGRTLCDLLAEHAAGHGDAPAMSWRRDGAWQTLSWRDYRERVAEGAMCPAGRA